MSAGLSGGRGSHWPEQLLRQEEDVAVGLPCCAVSSWRVKVLPDSPLYPRTWSVLGTQ